MPPTFEIDPTIHIDDKTADTFVRQMMSVLDADFNKVLTSVIPEGDASCGNPTGQKRLFLMTTRLLQRSLLAADLKTGHRKKFSMCLDVWVPDNGWLHGCRFQITGNGPNKPTGSSLYKMASISRHALVRAVQRADCRTPNALIHLLSEAWTLLQLAGIVVWEAGARLPLADEPGWCVPVPLPDAGKWIFLVLKDGGWSEDRNQPMVAVPSVLTGHMVDDPEGLINLFDDLAAKHNHDLDALRQDVLGLRRVFEASTHMLKRARVLH